jgi:hypothetical protein
MNTYSIIPLRISKQLENDWEFRNNGFAKISNILKDSALSSPTLYAVFKVSDLIFGRKILVIDYLKISRIRLFSNRPKTLSLRNLNILYCLSQDLYHFIKN